MRNNIRKQNIVVLISFIIIISILFIPYGTSNTDQITPSTGKRITYIYEYSGSIATEHESFLENNGYIVDVFQVSEVNSTNLQMSKLINIEYDTAKSPSSVWKDPTKVAIIDNYNVPILGMGMGGVSFLDNLSLDIGYGDCWVIMDVGLNVVNPTHPIFNTPIDIPKSSNLTINNQSVSTFSIYVPTAQPNLRLLGREAGDLNH
ncbi:MAG: hypothetical protein GF317_21825 [Candidatus Lokiarchaeota archaeon]|nr:hypothetical protein [Candidatus Lokiarchaeota archaeon]MBD3202101.1 hypothetical protein [Candidatus Lokiarchaeota archaeon]